jgi:hypothetical protein
MRPITPIELAHTVVLTETAGPNRGDDAAFASDF